MREIIFRGKRKDNGEWVYGSLVYFGNYCGIAYLGRDNTLTITSVDSETVGEFTGLIDLNFKRIFEGDVIQVDLDRQTHVIKTTIKSENAVVEYRNKGFIVHWV